MDAEEQSVEQRLTTLLELVQENYKCTLPSDFSPPPSEFTPVGPTDRCVRLCNSLLKAKMDKNGVLLDVDLSLYEAGKKSPFYLRKVYFDLLEYILRNKDDEDDRFLVLGSPGTGKSLFHAFCLFIMLKSNAPILFVRKGWTYFCYNGLFYKCIVPEFSKSSIMEHNIWIVYDSNAPPPLFLDEPIVVLVSSLRKENYKHYRKAMVQPIFYMPLWGFNELEVVYGYMKPQITLDELETRYEVAGGVPRHIFRDWDNYEEDLEQAIKLLNVKCLNINEIDDIHSGIDVIFGIFVAENDYTNYTIDWLSLNICVRAFIAKKDEITEHISLALKGGYCVFYYAPLGRSYELSCLYKLCTSNLEYKCVSTDREMAIENLCFKAPNCIRRSIKSIEQIVELDAPCLWVFSHTNYPCVEAFLILPNQKMVIGVQVTLRPSHPLPYSSLVKICNFFERNFQDYSFNIVFVVREGNYERFEKQLQKHPKKFNSPVDEDEQQQEDYPLRQFKLLME